MKILIVFAALCALAYGGHVYKYKRAQRLDGRIVGGEDAQIEDYPYQLSLRNYGFHICGAAIISANWALTAAHCVDSFSSHAFSLRAGSSHRNEGGFVHQVDTIIVHPEYGSWGMDFDYALIKVSDPFPVGSAGVEPIALADSAPGGGADAVVSGWGRLSSGGEPSVQLQRAEVNIVDRAACREAYEGYNITDQMICARAPGKDACQGDSGGPLASGGVLVGVVSWGTGCADPKYPGVYSDVAAQRDWILLNSEEDEILESRSYSLK